MPFAVQPTYEGLVKSRERRTPAESILESALTGYAAFTQAQEGKAKREKEAVDTYISLRKAGYSAADAHKRTLARTGLGVPGKMLDEEDKELERDKTRSEIEKNKAAAKESEAKAKKEEAEAALNAPFQDGTKPKKRGSISRLMDMVFGGKKEDTASGKLQSGMGYRVVK